jgi:23S rRNA pseudouridine955/2504/2580 synthase
LTGVQTLTVTADEADLRLDRWFKRHFPALTHGRLEKLLRTGQIRVDGKRAASNLRLEPGAAVRVPPLPQTPAPAMERRPVSEKDARALRAAVLYKDDDMLGIDKPAGLAVQGGSKLDRHLDAMLDALRFDAPERPRLVHRLDRDTSGVLLLARHARAAAALTEAFRAKTCQKTYWAIVVGVPKIRQGKIDLPLAKLPGRAGERVVPDEAEGKSAITTYRVVDHAGTKAAWLELSPLTGRTHQLRAHCAALGTPILGDGKYGGAKAHLHLEGAGKGLQLLARAIEIGSPSGRTVTITAPMPAHMKTAFEALGFNTSDKQAKRR